MHLQLRVRKRKKHKNYDELASVFIFSLFQNDLLSLIFFPRIIHTYRNSQDDQVVYLTQLKLCNNELLSRGNQEKFWKTPWVSFCIP